MPRPSRQHQQGRTFTHRRPLCPSSPRLGLTHVLGPTKKAPHGKTKLENSGRGAWYPPQCQAQQRSEAENGPSPRALPTCSRPR